MENRNGLLVDLQLDIADGRAERRNAIAMLDAVGGLRRLTVAADKGYDTRDFIAQCRARNVSPHVAQTSDTRRASAIDGRTTRHEGYAVSQRIRKRVEEVFGWMKTVGNFRKTRYVGLGANEIAAYMIGAAYNLLRIAKLWPDPRLASSVLH